MYTCKEGGCLCPAITWNVEVHLQKNNDMEYKSTFTKCNHITIQIIGRAKIVQNKYKCSYVY